MVFAAAAAAIRRYLTAWVIWPRAGIEYPDQNQRRTGKTTLHRPVDIFVNNLSSFDTEVFLQAIIRLPIALFENILSN